MGCWILVNSGLPFLLSCEKAGAVQPPARVCLSREQFVKQRRLVVTPSLCGQRPGECQRAGHCLDRKDLPFCQHWSICLLPAPWELFTGSLQSSRCSEHSQGRCPRQLPSPAPDAPLFSGFANRFKLMVQRILLVISKTTY